MAVIARNIIVHKVQKYQKEKAKTIQFRNTLLPVENDEEDTTYKFIQEFSRIYKNHRKTSRTFGEFEDDENEFPVSRLIRDYISGDMDFLDLSKVIATQFKVKITDIPMATGGYLFCIDYDDSDERCFAIVS